MNDISNRQVICQVLSEHARAGERDIAVLCSDSRGSSSLSPFAEEFPHQFFEMGIAEQSLVSTAAGLAACGKRAYAASPACFLTTRSLEQIKVDVAYSHTGVKLIGISGGVSYGALGMTHHSAQDIAAVASIPGMRVFLPCDRFETRALMEALLRDDEPAYIRVARNPSRDVHPGVPEGFAPGRAIELCRGNDVTLAACGETVFDAVEASRLLKAEGIRARVLDFHTLKPLDKEAVLRAARETRGIVTMEEHVQTGGLGSMISQITAGHCPCPVLCLTLPDAPVIAGSAREVFRYYGLTPEGMAAAARKVVFA